MANSGSGRRITTTLPDGTFQYQESNLLGQTTRQWGSQSNPVSFTYDSVGNQATMTTYRAPVGAISNTFEGNVGTTAGDTTAWRYDPSGMLLGKRDEANQEVIYAYDIAGRMLTRTRARGVVTVYSYTAGQLTSVEYFGSVGGWENYRNLRAVWQAMAADPGNHTAQEIADAEAAMLAAKAAAVDATTPAVANSFDRLGRQTSSSSLLSSVLQSSVSYAYDPVTLALDTETITIDPDGSGPLPALTRILDRSRDNLGREGSTGILPVSNGTPEHSLTYGYDASGRLSTTTSPAGTFTYAYTPNSSLIATVTPDPVGAGGPVHTVTNFWETHRNVLDIKENKIPSTTTTISSFNYGVNQIGQRTGVTTSGTAFPSQPADWTWGYDALGQVTSADSPDNNHDRAYECGRRREDRMVRAV